MKSNSKEKPHNCQVDLKIFCVKDICCCAPGMEISALGVTRRADRFSVWGPCVKNAAVRRKMGPNAKHFQEELLKSGNSPCKEANDFRQKWSSQTLTPSMAG